MEVVVVPDPAAVAQLAAGAIERLVAAKPDAVIGLATGSTPLPLYAQLSRRRAEGRIDFAGVRAVMLDEYLGLPTGHPQSYRRFLLDNVVGPIGLDESNLIGPDVTRAGAAVEQAAAEFEERIRSLGGVDLQILGIGSDGHIGFNEPTSSLGSRTRIKTLTSDTRHDNARFFDHDIDQVPRHVITQGIGTILDARHLVLLATGEGKAEATARAIEGPVSSMVPASALQLHPHATVIVDHEAAGRLRLRSYYEETYAAKPSWQQL